MNEIKFVGELQRCDVKPGDRFVLKVPRPISQETAARIKDAWAEFYGSDDAKKKLLILEPGFELGVLGAEPETIEG